MQLYYQDTMTNFMTSFSYQDPTEDFLSASTMYEYPDPLDISDRVDSQLQLNDSLVK
jgi:hypothetical protein